MHISQLRIEGYKGFKDPFNIEFSKGVNIIVGENGSGKTAVIDAIRLLLMEDEFGRTPIFNSDFNKPFGQHEASRSFRLQLICSGMSNAEMSVFLPWTDLSGTAKLTIEVDNKQNSRGRFKKTQWGGDAKSSFFEFELFDTINCIYLPPLRDAESKLREGKASRLARLLKNLNKSDRENLSIQGVTLEEKVKLFNAELANDSEGVIARANAIIRERLKESLGHTFGQSTLIQFSETNFDNIVERLRLFFFPGLIDHENEFYRGLEENSLGYNNLLYIATVLSELTSINEETYLKVLLIEEPEAHLHPQLQVKLLNYFKDISEKNNIQVIMTTHSPILSASSRINSLIHLSCTNDKPIATPLSQCGLQPLSLSFIERWLDITKSTLFFAKGVILVEGIAEAMLIPILAQRILAEQRRATVETNIPSSLEEAGISVINMNGIYFKHFMQFFANLPGAAGNALNIPIRCSGITDYDPPRAKIELPDNDGNIKKTYVESKPISPPDKSGNHAVNSLMDKINQSTWARLYHSPLKTLEYDLSMENAKNCQIMMRIAAPLCGPKVCKRLYEKSMHTDDIGIRADNSLYLLEHIDKGEYSQRLASFLQRYPGRKFAIPIYIKEAVLWACGVSHDA